MSYTTPMYREVSLLIESHPLLVFEHEWHIGLITSVGSLREQITKAAMFPLNGVLFKYPIRQHGGFLLFSLAFMSKQR